MREQTSSKHLREKQISSIEHISQTMYKQGDYIHRSRTDKPSKIVRNEIDYILIIGYSETV